jgi:hypothetical protein
MSSPAGTAEKTLLKHMIIIDCRTREFVLPLNREISRIVGLREVRAKMTAARLEAVAQPPEIFRRVSAAKYCFSDF